MDHVRARPEWKHIEPLKQDDDENPVEKSMRALGLTQDAEKLYGMAVPAGHSEGVDKLDYSRTIRRIIKFGIFARELDLTENILNIDEKNYHEWPHRRPAIKS
ncbi:farnesyltransferase alpha subunit [Culex quinquefasciatus]|uniref:Farnesyltransferase alpha subunit n=1 Tax=Culex quinquefasciatus TaxID=7176 RepID=B0WUX4_CULQU|nr:farnesyltransferase alpha subunit [Culex quinquefasciatus]|eukprot:XP_001859899.1 farnesyltransferase alpha subunit [Culex quinquefasciatus]